MKLSDRVLEGLAAMVTGGNNLFPYRSSWYITKFFGRCGLPFKHSKETRRIWVYDRLVELNVGNSASNQDLPSADLVRVISQTFDVDEFEAAQKELQPALDDMNRLLKRSGLAVYLDASQRCHLKNTGSGVNSAVLSNQPRPLSQEEIAQRQRLTKFLDSASEDEFTQRLLVPFFQRLGFHRVSAAGHNEKTLEFGKDLWMKFQIPTGHWVYFCAQVKRDKIDAGGARGNNVATILNQARMAIDHPIFDPDTNKQVLLDHLYLISAGEITRSARQWLITQLDSGQRRHIIFMDRDEFLDHSARILLDLRLEEEKDAFDSIFDDTVPF